MLKDYMESEYKTYKLSFGKFQGKLLTDLEFETSYIEWWLNKREIDEANGNPNIDVEHKIASERKHKFNRTYLFFIYHLYKVHGYKSESNGVYSRMVEKFWLGIENNVSNNHWSKDELEGFFYSLWSADDEPRF